MADWRDRIDWDSEIIGGKPKIKGTRIAVELVLEWLAAGETEQSILQNYPHLTHEDVLACLGFASELARDVKFYSAPA